MRVSSFKALLVMLLAQSGVCMKQLLVGLKHSPVQEVELKRRFWSVSDPNAADYQAFHTRNEIAQLVMPSRAALKLAQDWISSLHADLPQLTASGDVLIANVETSNSTAPFVPSHLEDVIDFVVLLSPEVAPRAPQRPKKLHVQVANNQFGPQEQKAAYQVPKGLKGTNKKNSQMVFGTGTFGYRADDLKLFYDTYSPDSSTSDVSLDKDNAWKGQTGKNFVEGMLDVSYITAMAPGVRTIVANPNASASTEAGEDFGGALLAFLTDLNGRDELPYVLSMSLGSLSHGSCDRACNALATKGSHTYKECWEYLQTQFQACMFSSASVESRIDIEFAKLGLRGVTVVAASGDGGSHFAFGPFSGSIGEALNSIICEGMHLPVYPTSSPYVLSVGGSEWQSEDMYGPTCSTSKPCGWESGGGGFAWDHAAPYQANTTSSYLNLAKGVAPQTQPKIGTFNSSGRAYPDLVALAQFGIPLCTYGGCSGSGGTSASAPTVAGMISLINDARLNKGLKQLGFINTRLYNIMTDKSVRAECFKDIGIDKVGDLWDCPTYSTCTGCDSDGKGPGFVATSGWDAQTGFGQPLFDGLMKHLGADSFKEDHQVIV